MVSVGKKVPEFSLYGTKNFKLKDYKGQNVVIYFYPKDATPGCTTEGHDFNKKRAQFRKYNTVIFGVSRDSVSSHEKFKEKQGYKFELLSDPDEEVCKIFDVIKTKNMCGRKFKGIERSTFVIDEKGRLVKEWRGVKVSGHVDKVYEFIKSSL